MDSYLDFFARAILTLGNQSIVPLLIMGYIWMDRRFFLNAICLVVISMIFNTALKVTFQIPLNPSIGKEGFAFPSGHMQTAVVFYGLLYKFVQNMGLKLFLSIFLVLIGVSLIYFDYHDIKDVLGAVLCALSLIGGYKYFEKKTKPFSLFVAVKAVSTVLLLYIGAVHVIPPHLWMAYYALLGVLTAQSILGVIRLIEDHSKTRKTLATFFCFSFFALINAVIAETAVLAFPVMSLKWFCVGVSIPFSVFLSTLVYKQSLGSGVGSPLSAKTKPMRGD